MAITMVFYRRDGIPIIYPRGLILWDAVDPPTWKHDFCFSSTTVCLCMFTIPVLKSLYTSELLINASIKPPLWLSPFFQKSEWEILGATSRNCSFNGVVVIIVPQSYLDVSRMKPWLCIAWSESFWRGFPVLMHSCSTYSELMTLITCWEN
jgi:hypothetical protein